MLDPAFLDACLRVWLVVCGMLVAGHYHAMANFMREAPHVVKAIALPLVTGAGVGMVYSGASGVLHLGMLFSVAAAGLMAIINLAAWSSGAYVSEQFARAAAVRRQIKRDGWAFVNSYKSMSEAVDLPDSEPAPLEAQKKTKGLS
jgi:hypothetical protein